VILAYQDAGWREEGLWYAARARAAELGADAVLLAGRQLAACRTAAYSENVVSQDDYRSDGKHFAVGAREFECVQLVVEALVLGSYNCKTDNNCRYSRSDARNLDRPFIPAPLNSDDPRVKMCVQHTLSTSSTAPPRQ